MTDCATFAPFSPFLRSDHHSGSGRHSALHPHRPPPRCYLLAEGSTQQPGIPPRDQPGRRRGILTEAQAPPSKIYGRGGVLGQQRRR